MLATLLFSLGPVNRKAAVFKAETDLAFAGNWYVLRYYGTMVQFPANFGISGSCKEIGINFIFIDNPGSKWERGPAGIPPITSKARLTSIINVKTVLKPSSCFRQRTRLHFFKYKIFDKQIGFAALEVLQTELQLLFFDQLRFTTENGKQKQSRFF